MEEKIKIYISEKTGRILDKDAELFEFLRKDGRINRNAFLNTLILNYFGQYSEQRARQTGRITEELRKAGIEEDLLPSLSEKLLQTAGSDPAVPERLDTVISLKPTRRSSDVIRYIEAAYLGNTTLSRYFRDLFVSYVSMPQDEREKIIFQEQFQTVAEAIRLHRKISFITERYPGRLYTVSPYMIVSSREELFNYLLAANEDWPYTFRMSRIRAVRISSEEAGFSERVLASLKKTARYGPQFPIVTDTEIRVRLSERGIRQFRSIYLHRPVPEKTEENIYYFRCSPFQIFQYFTRFGKDAVVLEPADLYDRIRTFYAEAVKAYESAKETI
jgi:hypothetical protein